ncbi:low molecular weight phosphatase family protein [Streptomyces sp. NPDC046900]|uniref:arsenate-mycothiol transferase ArsC n=1 Tax=Streptomyces sp. NPDC046900 TaxID=3155473 RepID=UPI00340B5E57
MTRVLFVCTGNVHRSVFAERLLAARLPPGSAVRPESAGTEARPRPGMENSTRAVLERLGGDGSGFSARPLTALLVAEAALVLGLAREHREAAVRLAPSAMRRCFTLKEFVRLAAGGVDGARARDAAVAVDGSIAMGAVDGLRAAAGSAAGGAGRWAVSGGMMDGEDLGVAGGFDGVVAAVAARRGATAPVAAAEDDVPDPWAQPHDVLYDCAREIDRAVSRLALLLGSGGASA